MYKLGQDLSIDPFAGVATDISSGTTIWLNPDSTFTVYNGFPSSDITADPVIVPTSPQQQGGDWWSSINWGTVKDVVGAVASGAGAVVRAITGQTGPAPGQVPPGYRYDPVTGRIVPTAMAGQASAFPSWLLPVGVLGIGAVLLMRKR